MKLCFICIYGILAVLCVLIQHGICATGTDAKNLRTQLFITDGYDRKVRPTDNQSDPIEVYVSLSLLNINELSETTETLKTTGYLWISWTDAFLQWDPVDYGDLEYYHWPQGDVWKPDVALKNSYLEYKELGVSSLNVYVDNNGFVEWYPFQVFQSTCSVDITYFPFDTQECKLKFVAWSYSKAEVTMVSGEKGIEMDQFETNSEWDVIDTSYSVDWESGEAAVIFRIKIKRKPLYVLLSVIMPIIMLAILNIFVFVLPCESGEKASYAITVFLAFAVFLSIISSTFPENSEVVAVFSIYLIIQTLQSTMISLLALSLVRFTSFDDDQTPVPRCIQSVLRFISCRPCRDRHGRNKVTDDSLEINDINKEKQTRVDGEIDSYETPKNVSDYSWKEVVNLLDKVFFFLFSLILITSTMGFFISVAVSN